MNQSYIFNSNIQIFLSRLINSNLNDLRVSLIVTADKYTALWAFRISNSMGRINVYIYLSFRYKQGNESNIGYCVQIVVTWLSKKLLIRAFRWNLANMSSQERKWHSIWHAYLIAAIINALTSLSILFKNRLCI